eukprot:gnl/Spiro4/7107_TR3697_c0_g1_i1.p1 gnl/Spiro4/7107_TR3697_c0_g1~~gnl/Spiro4/7107_TR3697_c0_g1_i1.p1  ORF type:complete len:629 (+),score=128.05 gnl/Spiro4/7107_TR3697_c0_g1_i1:34-1887(+)
MHDPENEPTTGRPARSASVGLSGDVSLSGWETEGPEVLGPRTRSFSEPEPPPTPDEDDEALEDLSPTTPAQRSWGFTNFAALWTSVSISVPLYMFSASLLSTGLDWWQSVLAPFLGCMMILVPMVMNGWAGCKYGVCFPVFLRSSFGTKGALFAALVRGLVAIGYFGLNLYVGGNSLYMALVALIPSARNAPYLGDWLGLNLAQLFVMLLFLAVHLLIVYLGINHIKRFQVYLAPVLATTAVLLFLYFGIRVGVVEMLAATDNIPRTGPHVQSLGLAFFAALTAVCGCWSTMAMNIPDFTRYAVDQRSQIMGQFCSLPFVQTAVGFIAIAITGATFVLYGEPVWDPAVLIARIPSPFFTVVAALMMALSVISLNVTCNLVSPANDIANLNPNAITFKHGGYATCVVGFVIMPWKIFSSADSLVFVWLIGTGTVLAAVLGVMLGDFYVVRKMQLNVSDLYDLDIGSEYYFYRGFNLIAVFSCMIAVVPCAPGFLASSAVISPDSISEFFTILYDFSWLVSFALSFGMHSLLSLYLPIDVLASLSPDFLPLQHMTQQQQQQECGQLERDVTLPFDPSIDYDSSVSRVPFSPRLVVSPEPAEQQHFLPKKDPEVGVGVIP